MSNDAKTFLDNLKEMFTKHEQNMFDYHKKFFEDYNRLSLSIQSIRSAQQLIQIEEGVEYNNHIFFAIQCVKTNAYPCKIMTNQGQIIFPANSFVTGAIYPINILMLQESGNGEFVGYVN